MTLTELAQRVEAAATPDRLSAYPALALLARRGINLTPVTRSSDHRQPGDKIIGRPIAKDVG